MTRSVPELTVRTTSYATSARVGIRVLTPGLAGPDGTVRVYEGDTLRATVTITDGHGYVRLTHLSPGTHHLVLRYQGPGPQVPASKRVAITVG